MIKIQDNDNNLLAIILKEGTIFNEEKHFFTENEEQMQLASFNLSKNTTIDNHIHLNKIREINTTSEVIVVFEGSLEVSIFDNDLDLITTEIINAGEVITLFQGGHGIKVLEDSKFIEAKQGPYLMDEDKKRF
jgi:hypothetical protein